MGSSAFCSVDMAEGTTTQPTGVAVVFFARDHILSPVKMVKRVVQTTAMVRNFFDRWVVVDVLAVVKSSLLQIIDGAVDLTHSLGFIDALHVVARAMFQHPARNTQFA